jgi:hypothetical protein
MVLERPYLITIAGQYMDRKFSPLHAIMDVRVPSRGDSFKLDPSILILPLYKNKNIKSPKS